MVETRIYEVEQTMSINTVPEWNVDEVAEEFVRVQSVEEPERKGDLKVTCRVPYRMSADGRPISKGPEEKVRQLIEATLEIVDANVEAYHRLNLTRVDSDQTKPIRR